MFFLVTGIVFYSCRQRIVPSSVSLSDSAAWQSGDLIFKTGTSLESRLVTELGGNRLTHVGILVHSPGGWLVVHAATGEDDGDTDSVKCEMVRSFACGDRCKSVKVVHVSCDTAVTQRAVRFALQQIGKPFDADFDITDTTKYYCTELVWQAYRHQHVDLSHGRRHHIQLLGLKKTCILPADLLP